MDKLDIDEFLCVWTALLQSGIYKRLVAPLPIYEVHIAHSKCHPAPGYFGYDWCDNTAVADSINRAQSDPSSYFWRLEPSTKAQIELARALCEYRDSPQVCTNILLYALARENCCRHGGCSIGESVVETLEPMILKYGVRWHNNCKSFIPSSYKANRNLLSLHDFYVWAAASLSSLLESQTIFIYITDPDV